MRNAVKYIGLFVIVVVLIFNAATINKLVKQNEEIKTRLIMLDSQVNSLTNGINSNQHIQTLARPQKDVMTPVDLADYLGIDMDKVYLMVENKDSKIPYINIDGEYKFSKAAIDEWMKTQTEIMIKR